MWVAIIEIKQFYKFISLKPKIHHNCFLAEIILHLQAAA